MAAPFVLPLDAFLRSVALNPNARYAVFLGAGASVASGIPDAVTCIWQWKRAIFLSNNVGCREYELDLSRPEVRALIQAWLDTQGIYPPDESPDEYCVYVEACYPIEDDRRLYFQQLAKQAEPSVGYYWLCRLATVGLVRSIWTTNFDGLTLRTALLLQAPITVQLNRNYAHIWLSDDGPLYVALHGDYRYSALKNTAAELRRLDKSLRQLLLTHLKDQHLIVTGYSGRDATIMTALGDVYAQPGSGRLYWCGYPDAEPDERVQRLLHLARSHRRAAYYVPTPGFDDLLTRLAQHRLPQPMRETIEPLNGSE